MNYSDVLSNARQCIGQYCKACPVCNGVACKNQIPGPGAKGVGDTAIRNYNKWAEVRVNMDTLCESGTPDTHVELFGKRFKLPFFAGPVGAVNLHYSDAYNDMTYNDVLVRACAENGIAAFTGDGVNPDVMTMATKAIGAAGGCGVPTIKPWNIDTVKAKMEQAKASGCFAVAMDVDAAGLPFLKNMTPPAGSKSVAELREIVALAGRPFIVKGVMTVKGALKAKEAGAAAIVVSNHGGRVLDQCPATAEVLPEIADALKGSGVKILVDGGIRSGVDVFKALALGADAVLICRPFVTAVYGGGEEGVELRCGAEFLGAAEDDFHAEHRASQCERVRHIAGGVAEEHELFTADTFGVFRAFSEVFNHREHIGIALAGVEQIGERVDDRQPRIFREQIYHLLLERADYDAVEESAEDFRGVLDCLAARNLEVVRLQDHRVSAEFVNARLERKARARALFEEYQPPALPAQNVKRARRTDFLVAVCECEYLRGFGGGQVCVS